MGGKVKNCICFGAKKSDPPAQRDAARVHSLPLRMRSWFDLVKGSQRELLEGAEHAAPAAGRRLPCGSSVDVDPESGSCGAGSCDVR